MTTPDTRVTPSETHEEEIHLSSLQLLEQCLAKIQTLQQQYDEPQTAVSLQQRLRTIDTLTMMRNAIRFLQQQDRSFMKYHCALRCVEIERRTCWKSLQVFHQEYPERIAPRLEHMHFIYSQLEKLLKELQGAIDHYTKGE